MPLFRLSISKTASALAQIPVGDGSLFSAKSTHQSNVMLPFCILFNRSGVPSL